jgi:hypothetical protein
VSRKKKEPTKKLRVIILADEKLLPAGSIAIIRPKLAVHKIDVGANRKLGLHRVVGVAASHALNCKSSARWGIVRCRELDHVAARRERPGKGRGIGQRHGRIPLWDAPREPTAALTERVGWSVEVDACELQDRDGQLDSRRPVVAGLIVR